MTVRVQLVASGLTPGARRGVIGSDEPLDEHGRAGAARLAGAWPPMVLSSCAPAAQCRETAALAGLAAQPDLEVRDWDLGSWAGVCLAELAAAQPDELERWSADPDFDGHGGESLRRLRMRASDWLDRLAGARTAGEGPCDERPGDVRPGDEWPAGNRLVTVTHAPFIRAALLCVLDAPIDVFWRLDVEPLASVHLTLRPARRAVRWSAGRQ